MTMRIVTFKLDEEVLEKLDRYARRTGKSRSEVIRLAIERLLENDADAIGFPTVYRVRIY